MSTNNNITLSGSLIAALVGLRKVLPINEADMLAGTMFVETHDTDWRRIGFRYQSSIDLMWHQGNPTGRATIEVERGKDKKWQFKSVMFGLDRTITNEEGLDPEDGRCLMWELDELTGVAVKAIAETHPEALTRMGYDQVHIRMVWHGDGYGFIVWFPVRDKNCYRYTQGESTQVVINRQFEALTVLAQYDAEYHFYDHSAETGWLNR